MINRYTGSGYPRNTLQRIKRRNGFQLSASGGKPLCQHHPRHGSLHFQCASYLCILSFQLNEQIATFLDTDREVCNFRRICHATDAAVEAYRCGVWRDRFARRYDMPEKVGGWQISMIYKIRSKLLRKSAKFVMGHDPREIRCMEILRDLIVGERCHGYR